MTSIRISDLRPSNAAGAADARLHAVPFALRLFRSLFLPSTGPTFPSFSLQKHLHPSI
jgi:hypothetical protein